MGREALNESWSRTWIARALASLMGVWGRGSRKTLCTEVALRQPPFRVSYAVLDLADDIGLVFRALRETL